MRYIKLSLLSLVFSLSLQTSANAAIINLGVLNPLHLENFTFNFTGGVADTYIFTIPTPFAFTSSVTAGGDDVSSLTTTLTNLPFSTVGTTTAPLPGIFNSSIVESFLNAGDYSFAVTVSGTGDNTYFGNFTAANTSVAAVPEPSAYAMFIAGLGLLSFAAKRRKS